MQDIAKNVYTKYTSLMGQFHVMANNFCINYRGPVTQNEKMHVHKMWPGLHVGFELA